MIQYLLDKQRRFFLVLTTLILGVALSVGAVLADTKATDFESFSLGSVNGQSGWSMTGSFDVEIVDAGGTYPSFGNRSLRISNAVTSGSFGDQTFSQSLDDEAGETDAENNGLSGGVRQEYFEAEWEFASAVPGSEQAGLSVVVSPDRGDGARMGWIQMADTPSGLEVNYYGYDTTLGGTCSDLTSFVLTNVASGLDRTVPHTIKVTMEFVDGINNDVVKVYVDGNLVHTGKSWEDFFRNCQPPGSRTVDSLLFRTSGTAAPATSGDGFYIDNVSLFSGAVPVPPCTTDCYVDAAAGSDSNSGTVGDPFATIQKAIDTVDPNGTVHVADGTYTEAPNVNKAGITIDGESKAGTIIDASSFAGYSLEVTVDDVTLQDFSLIGNPAGTYGIKAAGPVPTRIANFTVENVLVDNSRSTGVDLNGVDGALIKDVEVKDVPSGNGLAITDSNNIVFENITTSNNAWGGLAIYTFGRYFSLGSDNVTIQGTNSFGEDNKVYVQRGNYSDPANPEPVTNLTVNGFAYTVMNDTFRAGGENFTFYQITRSDAINFALGLATPLDSYVNEIATGDFFVADGMSIQTAIDHASAGDTVNVGPGTYNEIAEDRSQFGAGVGPYDFGLYVGLDNLTIQGADSSWTPITDYNNPEIPQLFSTASSVFGTQGPFISGDRVTISGLDITANAPANNKNVEVVGDDFTLTHSRVRMDQSSSGSSVYISDFQFSGDDTSGTATVTKYTISDNWFDGGSMVVANGAGFGSPPSDLIIANNLHQNAGNWGISMNGALTGIAWLNHPVGVPLITGNTFDNNFGHVRFLGTYDSYEASYWTNIISNNSFPNGWVAAFEGSGPDLRATELYSYVTRRQLGGPNSTIQNEIDRASEGDTVEVSGHTFNEALEISTNNLTLLGAGPTETQLVSDVACTNQMNSSATAGVRLVGDHSGITLQGFSVFGYDLGLDIGENIGRTISNVTIENVNASNNCVHGILSQAGDTDGVSINNVAANNNGAGFFAGRGIWMINGTKADISITNSEFNDNRLVGIDLSDGDVTGVNIVGNTVEGNGDSGIGVLGPQGPDANLIDDNTVTDNGRFGIEIKNPSGATTVSNNTVSLTGPGSDTRDYAGIAVFRRSPGATNADQPSGVTVTGNTVSGFIEPNGDGEGFGIVVEGNGMGVTENDVSGNDIGIQVQEGNPTPNTNGTDYFDRGDAGVAADVTVNENNITGNGEGLRAVGTTNDTDGAINWWGDASGPSGEGTGAGDSVSANVTFCPWLDAPFPGGSPVSASGGFATTSTDGHTTQYCTIEAAMFASSGANQEVHVSEGDWPQETMTRDYSDSPDLLVKAIGDRDNTIVNGVWLGGASFDGLTFDNFTFTGDHSDGYSNYNVALDTDGNYADLAFVNSIFDGRNAADVAAIFLNRGFDGFKLENNTFKNFENSLARPSGSAVVNYSLIFAEAQSSDVGDNYVVANNTFENVRHLNSIEAYRWKNVTITGNQIGGVHGRILVWNDGSSTTIEQVLIKNNDLDLSSGTSDYDTTGIGVYYMAADVNIEENDIDNASTCITTIGISDLAVVDNTLTNCAERGHYFNEPGGGIDAVSAAITGNTFDTSPIGVENFSVDFELDACDNTFIDIGTKRAENPGPFAACEGNLQVTKVVDWNGIAEDPSQTFEICIQGASYPNGDEAGACQEADFDGATLTWSNLEAGDYIVSETPPGQVWSVQIDASPVTVEPEETAQVTVTNTNESPKYYLPIVIK